MRAQIISELEHIERDEQVKIIFACEAGSRAWGLQSNDSDFDVRFFYIHHTDWYLSIEHKRDVINKPISDLLDISGWDIRKALQLYKKSNPSIFEWLKSSIIYAEHDQVMKDFRKMIPYAFSEKKCMYHYLHMAKRNYHNILSKESVTAKQYLQIIQPLLCCKWIEMYHSPPSGQFRKIMYATIPKEGLIEEIANLIYMKRKGIIEVGNSKTLVQFIEQQLITIERVVQTQLASKCEKYEPFNQIFLNALQEIWGYDKNNSF
ncbi:nucleotidyltransferase domain-containing protein [Cytobacillus sp. IB215665]|uniref:nucleotidyltransferase domain-containing protein n=1 Tax=Cytobacillus sp. IB215665 TaxID=3097357 RepID=UPI002A13A627|nr:nucleotidyltransferase domain-containing protein [Cytobacillus sp. IB215665]MDX8364537.1 nucleotidyltransferase domain-containing protein [Cytobacillus sp. IB215665]